MSATIAAIKPIAASNKNIAMMKDLSTLGSGINPWTTSRISSRITVSVTEMTIERGKTTTIKTIVKIGNTILIKTARNMAADSIVLLPIVVKCSMLYYIISN